MSLFGFAKDIGRRLFNKDEDAAERIKEHIEAANPGVSDLEVQYSEGIVNLSGECSSAESFQKCVLMAGNVQGVVDVYTKGLSVAARAVDLLDDVTMDVAGDQPEPASSTEVQYYVIESGDTLSGIAKRFYGDAMKYPQLFEANREVIEDPDKIYPGQKIRIPALG